MTCTDAVRRIAAVAAFAVLAASAAAQMPQGSGSNCMMDQLTKLCPDAKPGTPDFSACSKQRIGEAMAACKGQGRASGTTQPHAASGASTACAEQMQKLCPGMWPGAPDFIKCMDGRESSLPADCRATYEKRKAEHKTPDTTCVADSKKYCPGLTIMDHQKYMGCMRKNYDSLSPACQAKFKDVHALEKVPRADCMSAMEKACPDAAPGTPELTQCMMSHRDQMPTSCGDQ